MATKSKRRPWRVLHRREEHPSGSRSSTVAASNLASSRAMNASKVSDPPPSTSCRMRSGRRNWPRSASSSTSTPGCALDRGSSQSSLTAEQRLVEMARMLLPSFRVTVPGASAGPPGRPTSRARPGVIAPGPQSPFSWSSASLRRLVHDTAVSVSSQSAQRLFSRATADKGGDSRRGRVPSGRERRTPLCSARRQGHAGASRPGPGASGGGARPPGDGRSGALRSAGSSGRSYSENTCRARPRCKRYLPECDGEVGRAKGRLVSQALLYLARYCPQLILPCPAHRPPPPSGK